MINLAVGRLEIEWGKNLGFMDHTALFQSTDVTAVPYYFTRSEQPSADGKPRWEVITELKDGLAEPLPHVIDRINLLGHTPKACEQEFATLANFNGFDPKIFSFRDLQQALATVDVSALSPDYGEGGEDFGKFFRREIVSRLGLEKVLTGPTLFEVSEAMENLSAYTVLHLLSANPMAQGLHVQWAFNELEEGGWAKRSDFVRPVDQSARFLIVTEGSSDAAIIGKAFRLLRPHIADFFDFVDMEEGYPFSGTGNVYRFVQGFSIRVLNNVIVVYDNDAEGTANFARTSHLNLPDNMRTVRLPDLECFDRFPTIGPNGRHYSNINGQAAAIECYLDLPDDACVRWSSFNAKLDAYQGELINKEKYTREFVGQRTRKANYGYDNIAAVLELIVQHAVNMRETSMAKSYAAAYEQPLISPIRQPG